jgi:hypothetical protein
LEPEVSALLECGERGWNATKLLCNSNANFPLVDETFKHQSGSPDSSNFSRHQETDAREAIYPNGITGWVPFSRSDNFSLPSTPRFGYLILAHY